MNDFNFYTGREEIPVLTKAAQIDRLRAGPVKSYLLVKERDRRRLPELAGEAAIASQSLGNSTWFLLEINGNSGK
jgi:hypothetical protein